MDRCLFLEKLPAELRIRIYEELVGFDAPIKLRQVVPGAKDLPILRTNRQIYNEALSVLYEVNTIVVTRNDFCKLTDQRLKTPLRLDQARHLLMTSISQSIVCTISGPARWCNVCEFSATGLIEAFTRMPRLLTVVIDYHKHLGEMQKLADNLRSVGHLELEPTTVEGYVDGCSWRLKGPAIQGIDVQLLCGRPTPTTLYTEF